MPIEFLSLARRARPIEEPRLLVLADRQGEAILHEIDGSGASLAEQMIGQDADVIFQVAGGCGLGALNAAGERDRWGIGVAADQSSLGDHILTSAQKGVDAAVFLSIKAVQDGTWKGGGNVTFGLKEEGVGLGTVSPKVPQEDVDAVAAIEEQIANGEITGIPTEVGKS